MLTKYLIILLTPLAIVSLTIFYAKYKEDKLIQIVIILAMVIILIGGIIMLYIAFQPEPGSLPTFN